MSMVRCRYCKHGPIHVTARRCPRCGGKEPGSRPLEIVIALVGLCIAGVLAWHYWPM
jgi:hypothetical protein